VSRYACIDASNVVIQVVLWDGGPRWAPPAGQTAVLLPDDEMFIEARGTLDPKTMKFVRYEPTQEELDAERAAAAQMQPTSEKTVFKLNALVAVLVEKGTITPDDVKGVEDAAAGVDVTADPIVP
jgi:hypothetical protein